MATRRPESSPILDRLGEIVIVDPEPASIQHLQRIERWTHALYTEWGWPGVWIPCHMDQSETPDELEVPVEVPPGCEYFTVRAYCSQRDKTTPTRAVATLQSAATGSIVTLAWQEITGGNNLDGALEVFGDVPLQCRSGTAWTSSIDTVTVTFDTGTGVLWGVLLQPIWTPRLAS